MKYLTIKYEILRRWKYKNHVRGNNFNYMFYRKKLFSLVFIPTFATAKRGNDINSIKIKFTI